LYIYDVSKILSQAASFDIFSFRSYKTEASSSLADNNLLC